MRTFAHTLRRSLGLKIWLVCALLVALIPAWRERALFQWHQGFSLERRQNDPFFVDSAPQYFGLNASRLKAASQRFPHDLVLRVERLYSDADNQLVGNRQSAPTEATVTVEAASPQKTPDQSTAKRAYFARWRELVEKHPQELWIRAAWLRKGTTGGFALPDQFAPGEEPPKNQLNFPLEPWLPADVRRDLARGAAQGAQLEPENAFWSWMEAVYRLSLEERAQALEALERAGRASRFEDGTQDIVERRLMLLKKLKPLSVEDKFAEASGVLLPHFAPMRAVTRSLVNYSRQHDTPQRQLEIAMIISRAAVPVAQTHDSFISSVVGFALVQIAWRGVLEESGVDVKQQFANGDESMTQQERLTKVAALMEPQAQRLGRPDLAAQVQQQHTALQKVPLEFYRDHPEAHIWTISEQLMPHHWLARWLLRGALGGGALWLVLALVSAPREKNAARGPLFIGTLALGVSLAWLAYGAAEIVVALSKPQDHVLIADWVEPDNPFENLNRLSPLILSGVWSLAVFGAVLGMLKRSQIGKLPPVHIERSGFNWRRVVEILLYTTVGLSFVLVLLTFAQDNLEGILGELWPAPMFVFLITLLLLCLWHTFWARDKARLAALYLFGSVWFAISAPLTHEIYKSWIFTLLLLGIALAFLSAGFLASQEPLAQRGIDKSRIVGTLLGVFTTLSFGLVLILLSQNNLEGLLSALWPSAMFALLILLPLLCLWHILRARGKARLATIFGSLGVCLALTTPLTHDGYKSWPLTGLQLGIALAFLTIGAFLMREQLPAHFASGWNNVRVAAARARVPLGVLALWSALLYVGVAVARGPIERDLEQRLDVLIERGEGAYIEEWNKNPQT